MVRQACALNLLHYFVAGPLERWLAGEPVWAWPAGACERNCQWARRRPALAGLLSALALCVVLGAAAAGTLLQLGETSRQRDLARQARDDAERAKGEAEQAQAAAVQAQGIAVKAREEAE